MCSFNQNQTNNSTNAATRKVSAAKGHRTTIQTSTSSSSTWDKDIIEKLRALIRSSSQSLQHIFNDMDEDGNGFVSQTEFRNAIRKLGLGLSSREIDQLLTKIDTNADGKISYPEFAAHFEQANGLE